MRVPRKMYSNEGVVQLYRSRPTSGGEGSDTSENVLVLSAYHPEDGERASILVPSFEFDRSSSSSSHGEPSWRGRGRIYSHEVFAVEQDHGVVLREEPSIVYSEEHAVPSSSLTNYPHVHVSVPVPLPAPAPGLRLLQARNLGGNGPVGSNEPDPVYIEELPASPPVVVNNVQGVPASASLSVLPPDEEELIEQFLNFEDGNSAHGSLLVVAPPENNCGISPNTSSGASSDTSGNSPGPMFQCRSLTEARGTDHEPIDLNLDIDNLSSNDSIVAAFNNEEGEGILNEVFASAPLVVSEDIVTVRTTEPDDQAVGIGNLPLGAQFPTVDEEGGGLFTRIASMGSLTFDNNMSGTASISTFDLVNVKVEAAEYASNGDQFIDTFPSDVPFTGSIIFDSKEFEEANGGSANQIKLYDVKQEELDPDTSTGLFYSFDYQGQQQGDDSKSEPDFQYSRPPRREAFDSTSASTNYFEESDSSNSSTPFEDDEKNDETYSPHLKRKCLQKKKARTVSISTDSGVGVSHGRGRSPLLNRKDAGNASGSPRNSAKPPPNKRFRKRARSEGKNASSYYFRTEMGPHLRTISALLGIAGISRQSDIVPYEVFRRFKPVDIYRTIQKFAVNNGTGQNSSTEYVKKSDADAANSSSSYNWNRWSNEPLPFSGDQSQSVGLPSLIFYSSQAKLREGENRISFATKWEIDGKPNYSPSVLTSLGSAELNVTVDLETLAQECSNIEVLGDDKPLLFRLRDPTCIGLMYPSGKLIVVGAMSYHDFRVASRKFARMVQKTGPNVRLNKLSLHLYVGLVKLPFRIDLKTMVSHEDLKDLMTYECTECSEIVINMKETSVFCLVCESGAILMTGTKKEDLKTTLDMIYPCLRSFGVKY